MAKAPIQDFKSDEWRFYGRRAGRRLGKDRQALIETMLADVTMDFSKLPKDGSLNPSSLFGQNTPSLIMEIGFGNGEHLAEMMHRSPHSCFIGAEPFRNGVATFLKEVKDRNLPIDKLRLLPDDAIPLVKSLQSGVLDELYILNPDPWHKKRHAERRIVNHQNLSEFSRIMKPGSRLILSSDVPNLIDWMMTETFLHPDFIWEAKKADDWRKAPVDWIPTRYETKGAKGAARMNYLFFIKK